MLVTLSTRHLDRPQALVDLAERRAHYALGRFADVVRSVEIRLIDVNGPRGGEDIACSIEARLIPSGRLLVQGRSNSAESGVCTTLHRLAATIRRHVGRLQSTRHA